MASILQRSISTKFTLVIALAALGACSSGPGLRDEVADMLAGLGGAYKERSPDAVLGFYADTFAIEDPNATATRTAIAADGIQVTRTSHAFAKDDLRRALERRLGEFTRVDKAKFYLDDVREVGDGYVVDTWFKFLAERPNGERQLEEATVELTIVRKDGRFVIESQRVLERGTVDGDVTAFADRTAAAGLAFTHRSHAPIEEGVPIIPGNFSGSGASAGDLDGDGALDLLVGDGQASRVFRNRGDATFEDITAQVFGDRDIGDVRGAYLVDYDNDGWLDVFLARVKQPFVLMRNRGDLTFEDRSHMFGSVPLGQSESAVFGDLDNDGDVDFYIVNYGDWEETSWAYPLYNATDGKPATVLRNDGHTFTQIEDPVLAPPGWGLAASLADYDDDGDLDIYLVNDFGNNHLLRNDGDFRFVEVTEDAGLADQGFGMSAAFGDHDNDGDLDIYVANMHSSARWVFEESNFPLPFVADLFMLRGFVKEEMRKMTRGNSLFVNNGDGTFHQVAREHGVERNGWAWGANFLDYDNDGDLDIYCPNGFITGKDPADC